MKLHLAAIVLPFALLAVACNENAPSTRDSRSTGIGQTPNSPVAGAAGRPVADDPINIPQDARWTILCDSIATPDHIERAAELKSELIQSTGRRDFYVIHKEGTSVIYYGFYKAIRQDVDPAEHARSQADLNWVRTLVDSRTGQAAFREPIIMPIDGPDPDAPPEWNLANAPADMFWSLQIGAYKDVPDRKEAAVEAVREARKMGIQAYYYHGETVSSVCVGLWPVTAVKNQSDGSRYKDSGGTDDPNEPIIVAGGSIAPPNAQSEAPDPDGSGGKAKVMGIKIDIQDPTLKAAIAKYPHEVVNGEYHYKPLPNGERFFDQSFLVQVPHDGQAAAAPAPADTPESLPPTPDGGAQPDPTLGALRSLGGK